MEDYKLIYFDIKVIAEHLRLLFAYADVPYQDIRIPYNPPVFGQPAPIPPEIFQKLPYGQMPLLEFGDVSLSQSNAIGRFLAQKFNLYGANDLEGAKIDEIVDALKDYFEACKGGFRGIKNEAEKEAGIKNIVEISSPKYLGKFSEILKNNGGKFIVGNSTRWADLMLFHFMTQFQVIIGVDLIKDYPVLQDYAEYIESIPNIQKWLNKRPVTRI